MPHRFDLGLSVLITHTQGHKNHRQIYVKSHHFLVVEVAVAAVLHVSTVACFLTQLTSRLSTATHLSHALYIGMLWICNWYLAQLI
jgi:hypothetical protein